MIESQHVKVNGINAHYHVGGDGPPVILVHGVGAGVLDWKSTIGPLSQHHRVYALDMVGFGHSDKPRVQYTLAYYAAFLEHFMDAVELKRASLVGQCFGGAVVLSLALSSPDRIEKLVLANSASLGKEILGGVVSSLPSFLLRLLSRPTRRSVRLGWKTSVSNSGFITDELVEEAYQSRNMPGATYARVSTYRNNFGIGGQRNSLSDRLSLVTVPTLIIWGRKDRIFPIAQAENAHSLIGNSRLHVLEDCGHIPQLEKPDDFNRLVLGFLA